MCEHAHTHTHTHKREKNKRKHTFIVKFLQITFYIHFQKYFSVKEDKQYNEQLKKTTVSRLHTLASIYIKHYTDTYKTHEQANNMHKRV